MEQLLENINKLEQKHLYKLYNYLVEIFAKSNLPSHDAQHHLRVWLHCRGLLVELYKAGLDISPNLIESALIACFFHDTGLTIDIGEMHGKLGGQICQDYYSKYPQQKIGNFENIIQAIEFHDDKSLKTSSVENPLDMINLPRLVSTADDLDALGSIGVFRYIEIYLKRGVSDLELPQKVMQNLKNRFTSFINAYSSLHKFSDKQKLRYQDTNNFFSDLNTQLTSKTENPDSTLAVYNILKDQLINKKQNIELTIEFAMNNTTSSQALCFFSKLRSELEVTSAIILG